MQQERNIIVQITDDMVEVAHDVYWKFPRKRDSNPLPAMRAALEAVLRARSGNASKFVKELKDSAYWQSNEDYAKAVACIEELAVALKECLQSCVVDAGGKAWPILMRKERNIALAILDKWGLK